MLEGSPQPLPRASAAAPANSRAASRCIIPMTVTVDQMAGRVRRSRPARSQSGDITFLPLLRMQSW